MWWVENGFLQKNITDVIACVQSLRLPDTPDLTRFNVYAPHVKKLLINSRVLNLCENLDKLGALSPSTTLLPNLSTIMYVNSHSWDRKTVTWVAMLLCPSLNALRNGSQRSIGSSSQMNNWLDLEQTSELLHKLSSNCPNLESLDIYSSVPPNPKNLDTTLRPSLIDRFSSSIRSLLCLRKLSSSTIVLEPRIFLALGELPHLEVLAIHASSYNETIDRPGLPENAFLALQRLDLKLLNVDGITKLYGIKALVRQLSTLNIVLQPNRSIATHIVISLANPICALAENNSTLSSLTIDAGSPSLLLKLEPALFQCFRKFPLRRLALSAHTFPQGANMHDLLESLPIVDELSFIHNRSYETKLGYLRLFASRTELPNLRALEIGIDFNSVCYLTEVDFEVSRYQPLAHITLQSGFEQVAKYDLARQVAKYVSIPES